MDELLFQKEYQTVPKAYVKIFFNSDNGSGISEALSKLSWFSKSDQI
jgi:hypothetical protein